MKIPEDKLQAEKIVNGKIKQNLSKKTKSSAVIKTLFERGFFIPFEEKQIER